MITVSIRPVNIWRFSRSHLIFVQIRGKQRKKERSRSLIVVFRGIQPYHILIETVVCLDKKKIGGVFQTISSEWTPFSGNTTTTKDEREEKKNERKPITRKIINIRIKQ